MLNCDEALRLLAAYLDGEVERTDRAEVERHLEACRSCCSRAEFERGLRAQLAGLGRREPDPAFGERIQDMVRRFTGRAAPRPE